DDALVEHAIENVDETCPACGAFNCHAVLLCLRLISSSSTTSASGSRRRRACAGQRVDPLLQLSDFGAQVLVFGRAGGPRRQVAIVAPPVEPDLLCLVE